jgi:hypothetical protein
VRSIAVGEPSFPSSPFFETWNALLPGAMANAWPFMLAKAQTAESAPMNFLLVSMVLFSSPGSMAGIWNANSKVLA